DEIWYPPSEAQGAIAGDPRGARVVVWRDRICVASFIYEGTIACYRRAVDGCEHQRLSGVAPTTDAYRTYDESDELPIDAWIGYGAQGRFAISVYSSSRGFATTDTSLTHFTFRKVRGQDRLFAEIFDLDGNLTHSGFVENYEPFPSGPPIFEILHSTLDGLIYMTDLRDGFPVLRVVRLKLR